MDARARLDGGLMTHGRTHFHGRVLPQREPETVPLAR